jgi:hypothetical protein
MRTVWKFETARFSVALQIMESEGYQYDGDDEDGETQSLLDSGSLVAFDSVVTVSLDGVEIASDHLGGSVYYADRISEFWTDHRSPDPMNRNCEAFRARYGQNAVVCHYFPDMVREAVRQARATLCGVPRLRCAA